MCVVRVPDGHHPFFLSLLDRTQHWVVVSLSTIVDLRPMTIPSMVLPRFVKPAGDQDIYPNTTINNSTALLCLRGDLIPLPAAHPLACTPNHSLLRPARAQDIEIYDNPLLHQHNIRSIIIPSRRVRFHINVDIR